MAEFNWFKNLTGSHPEEELPKLVLQQGFCTTAILASVFAIVQNIILISATVRSPHLKNRCNILIAALAVFDTVTCFCLSVHYSMILAGYGWISKTICTRISSFFFFSLHTGTALILAVGIDRYLGMRHPIFYQSICIGSCFTCGFSLGLCLWILEPPGDHLVFCAPPLAISGATFNLWFFSNWFLCVSVVVVYSLAFKAVKGLFHTTNGDALSGLRAAERQSVFHSLLVIFIIYVLAWLLGLTIFTIVSICFADNPTIIINVTCCIGFLVLINTGSSCIVYFARSSLYQEEILEMFGRGRQSANSNQEVRLLRHFLLEELRSSTITIRTISTHITQM